MLLATSSKRYQKDNMIQYISFKSEWNNGYVDEEYIYQSQSITATAGVMPQVQWPCLV